MNPCTGSMSVGAVPQSVREVLLSFHLMPVLAARAVATSSSRSACAIGLSSREVRTTAANSFSISTVRSFTDAEARPRYPTSA
jgi:hypothetical protein